MLRRGRLCVSKLTSYGRPEVLMKRLVLDGCRHTHAALVSAEAGLNSAEPPQNMNGENPACRCSYRRWFGRKEGGFKKNR